MGKLSIQNVCWDVNPQPTDYESHPITTRPGLLPVFTYRLLWTL